MKTHIFSALASIAAVCMSAAVPPAELEMPDIFPRPDSVTVLTSGERVSFSFTVSNYHYEDWGFSEKPETGILDSIRPFVLSGAIKPYPISWQILTGFQETSYSDEGGQVERLRCDFHKDLSEQNNYIVFKPNKTRRDIHGKLTIMLVAFMRDSESGHRYKRPCAVHIKYFQPKGEPLFAGRIENTARYDAAGSRFDIVSTELAEGGMGKIVYRWEYDNGTGWKTLEDEDIYGFSTVLPSALVGSRCYVRRVALSGSMSAESNLCVIRRDDSFFPDKSYIRKRTFTDTATDGYVTDLTYYDGLGYAEQSIEVAASPQGRDVVTPIAYDSMHRNDAVSYLPYVGSSSNGKFDPDATGSQVKFYRTLYPGESPYFYTEKVYERSPLDRVCKRYRPGAAYRLDGEGKMSGFYYAANGPDEVMKMDVDISDGSLRVCGYFPAGKLFGNTVSDEDGHTTITYTDLQDRTVMTSAVISADERADTYFVYDDFGRLSWVITPEGMRRLKENSVFGKDSEFARRFCYVYGYDGYGRMVEKRSPGREPEYVVYDRRDRPVLTQDGNERDDVRENTSPFALPGKYAAWRRYEYDKFDRLCRIEHLYILSSYGRDRIQQVVDAEPDDFTSHMSICDRELLAEYRYDISDAEAYTAVKADTILVVAAAAAQSRTVPDGLAFGTVDGIVTSSTVDGRVRGLKTYEKLRVLAPGDAEEYIERAYYYDYRGRPVQTVERNRLGFITRTSCRYDFNGNLLAERVTAQVEKDAEPDTKTTLYTYDHRGRPLVERTALNGSDTVRTTYGYDLLGRLTTRTTGPVSQNNFYNLQGWLTATDYYSIYGSTKPDSLQLKRETFFRSALKYYDPQNEATAPSYTGNVSEWHWTYGNLGGAEKPAYDMYSFTYDGASRLTDSRFGNPSKVTEHNSETGITYDRNGNLLTMKRYGRNDFPDHDLTYTYDGNWLSTLADGGRSYAFGYDSNGNLVSDARKGLIFGYNALNLLREVKDSGGVKKAVYAYASDGTKLAAADAAVEGYEYVGPFVYRRSKNRLELESTAFTGGRLVVTNTSAGRTYTPVYYLTDHLGSVRTVLNAWMDPVERNDYYPFGTRWFTPQQAMTDNRYRYEGKEEQQLSGIDLLDYGSRMYDPFRGQWTSHDPLSENYYSHSPYSFCAGNPIVILDPNGEDWYRLWLDPEQQEEEQSDENEQNERRYRIMYTELTSQEALDKAGIEGDYLGRAVVVFNGSRNERLGEGDNLFGKGAVLADVTVYGPKGEDDIGYYKGYTMSSDPQRFGVVADGEYTINRLSPTDNKGPYGSDLAVNKRGRVPAMDNFNPAYPERKPGYLEGVFIHKSNNNGWAGSRYDPVKGKWITVSEGCLLIFPNQWIDFHNQLKDLDRFLMILNR